jgi:SAM-dependent methyltransferase
MQSTNLKERLQSYLRSANRGVAVERMVYHIGGKHFVSDLKNRSVLEIGAGTGLLSAWCAARGASRVVALEPAAGGSSPRLREQFVRMSQAVGLDGIVDYRSITFDEFCQSYTGKTFDYILMVAVINHLDEAATSRLHLPNARSEREAFMSMFRKIGGLLGPGGQLVFSDVGRLNFWHGIGVKSPFAPTIEWHKHQQPKMWVNLLSQSGFKSIRVQWYVPFRLRWLKFLFSWSLPVFFLASSFIVVAEKDG